MTEDLKAKDLIEILKTYEDDRDFGYKLIFNDNYIYWDWDTKDNTTVEEAINELINQSLDDNVFIDVEDGFIFRKVIGVEDKYYSKTKNILDFITE